MTTEHLLCEFICHLSSQLVAVCRNTKCAISTDFSKCKIYFSITSAFANAENKDWLKWMCFCSCLACGMTSGGWGRTWLCLCPHPQPSRPGRRCCQQQHSYRWVPWHISDLSSVTFWSSRDRAASCPQDCSLEKHSHPQWNEALSLSCQEGRSYIRS